MSAVVVQRRRDRRAGAARLLANRVESSSGRRTAFPSAAACHVAAGREVTLVTAAALGGGDMRQRHVARVNHRKTAGHQPGHLAAHRVQLATKVAATAAMYMFNKNLRDATADAGAQAGIGFTRLASLMA
ncbi:hypothetical protein ACFDR9_003840 [Janthinobacterium sp. CG_23.3]|uniref:hypothetical protein n=1 Tax=Janthinobacterium sp. CG_23.3 TaxID=3349634 RepID=UPI0038D361AC